MLVTTLNIVFYTV